MKKIILEEKPQMMLFTHRIAENETKKALMQLNNDQ
jgi:hypothetical protein